MIDIHMHVIPDVDDGSDTIEESLSMLRMAADQGVTTVFATPHSSAFDFGFKKVHSQYALLQRAVEEESIPVRLCLGNEVLCYKSDMEMIVQLLDEGTYPSMNGTAYVLAEFFRGISGRDAAYCLRRLQEAGYRPVIAHAERYKYIDLQMMRALHEAGSLIQINVYSVFEEHNGQIRDTANALLRHRLVDFAGSDAHRLTHRAPSYAPGLEYMYNNYEREYIDRILQINPETLLMK